MLIPWNKDYKLSLHHNTHQYRHEAVSSMPTVLGGIVAEFEKFEKNQVCQNESVKTTGTMSHACQCLVRRNKMQIKRRWD